MLKLNAVLYFVCSMNFFVTLHWTLVLLYSYFQTIIIFYSSAFLYCRLHSAVRINSCLSRFPRKSNYLFCAWFLFKFHSYKRCGLLCRDLRAGFLLHEKLFSCYIFYHLFTFLSLSRKNNIYLRNNLFLNVNFIYFINFILWEIFTVLYFCGAMYKKFQKLEVIYAFKIITNIM